MTFGILIDAAALRDLLADRAWRGKTAVLDCRFDLKNPGAGRLTYLAGHIPGARYADLNRDLSSHVTADSGRHPLPSPAALAAFFNAAGIGGDTQVVAYDEANGSMAARAWWLLGWMGHRCAAVLDGGFAACGPVEAGSGPPPKPGAAPGAVPARASPDAVATSAEVEAMRSDSRRLLVDARAPERFAGVVEPLDQVAGHVPGAVNHPFTANLNAQGHFLPPDELRALWWQRLAGRSPGDMIAMCGSGVTACHNLLAMASAGLPGAKLYAGSWSEWIRDPRRPVGRGHAG
jgi:thiosulfate/3-mercaptopyruvate sulfurtransferase